MLIDKICEGFEARGVKIFSIAEITKDGIDYRKIVHSSLCHNSYSVAKAFTVTAIGMLWDEGKISVDEKVYDVLGKYFPEEFDEKWKEVTIDNLLLHKIGLDKGFLDIDTEDVLAYGTKDYLKYAFSRKLPEAVGEMRVYSDAAYYILSRVVAERAGETLTSFLRKRLFNPLDFREFAWSECPYGHAMGATGLYIRSDDAAKLGWVYLNAGEYNGQKIVSKEWVDFALERGYELKSRSASQYDGYCKGGMYGQMVYFSKKLGCALAWHMNEKTGSASTKSVMDELGM